MRIWSRKGGLHSPSPEYGTEWLRPSRSVITSGQHSPDAQAAGAKRYGLTPTPLKGPTARLAVGLRYYYIWSHELLRQYFLSEKWATVV
jgi:hypothetical protein